MLLLSSGFPWDEGPSEVLDIFLVLDDDLKLLVLEREVKDSLLFQGLNSLHVGAIDRGTEEWFKVLILIFSQCLQNF